MHACAIGDVRLTDFLSNRFDIMADLTFSEPLYMLEGSEYSPWVRTIFGSIKAAARMRVLSRVPGLNQLLSIVLGPIAKEKQVCCFVSTLHYHARIQLQHSLVSSPFSDTLSKQRQHHAFTDERVDRRLAKDPPHPDLWSHILRRKDQTTGGLSLPEMRSNASIFMVSPPDSLTLSLPHTNQNHDKRSQAQKQQQHSYQA